MIKINPQPEPEDFNIKVRAKGRKYLKSIPKGSKPKWRTHAYWTKAFDDLFNGYQGVCAYLGCKFPSVGLTVDHFLPKSSFHEEAYEWSNYRLCAYRINARKGDSEVLDPFSVKPDTFQLNPVTGEIGVSASIPTGPYRSLCEYTISRLKLNGDQERRGRREALGEWLQGEVAFDNFARRFPFVAHEAARLKLTPRVEMAHSLVASRLLKKMMDDRD